MDYFFYFFLKLDGRKNECSTTKKRITDYKDELYTRMGKQRTESCFGMITNYPHLKGEAVI